MSVKYLLITPDEDGAPNRFMTEDQLQAWLKGDDGWKLQDLHFMTEEDLQKAGSDQNYWKDGENGKRQIVLLRVEFIQPKAHVVKTEWRVE